MPRMPAELETVVHLADLDLEVVQAVISDREALDASREHVVMPADAAEAPKL